MTNIIFTDGSDFSSITPVILVNPMGYSIADPSVKVIDTNNGTDFSGLRTVILIDTDGNNI
jgi:hypothetical protein